jgi:hypothetical protein
MSKTESFVTESYACVYDELGPIFCDYTEPGVKLHQFIVDSNTLSRTLSHYASHFVVPVSGFPRAASPDHGISETCCSPSGYKNSSFQ